MAGFENGLNLPVVRSRVTSRKLTIFLFASMEVILGEYFAYFFLNLLYLLGGLVYHCEAVVTVKAEVNFRYFREL